MEELDQDQDGLISKLEFDGAIHNLLARIGSTGSAGTRGSF